MRRVFLVLFVLTSLILGGAFRVISSQADQLRIANTENLDVQAALDKAVSKQIQLKWQIESLRDEIVGLKWDLRTSGVKRPDGRPL